MKHYASCLRIYVGGPGMDILNETAKTYFGIDYIFPYQRLVISNILRRAGFFGKEEQEEAPPNQVVLLPTGAGKSLCFMLPACLLEGLTIVAFPLLGLMADQLRRVNEAGIPGAVLKGGMPHNEKKRLWQRIKAGEIRILLSNPEMLILPETRRELKAAKISHLVLDEAHTIPEWGETFRPACLELGNILPEIEAEQITAFTATASPLILSKIKTILFKELTFNLVMANPDRTNIHYQVRPVLSRMRSLCQTIRGIQRPALIFCSSRRDTEQCAFYLRQRLCRSQHFLNPMDIRFYHAGLDKALRTELEQWFLDSDEGLLCATCAYGMGMDKPNVRTVIHYSLPSSVEAYLQESGRAGRDRQASKAILLYHPLDKLKEIRPPDKEARHRYEKLLDFAENKQSCRRESLLSILDASPEDCESCDVCCGQVMTEEPNEKRLKKLLQKYRKSLEPKEWSNFLLGRYSRSILESRFHLSRDFGSFKDWKPDDLAEALTAFRE